MKDVQGQENGTVQSGARFGPAQRTHYPPSQWALAPIASSREILDHPPPLQRRRRSGEPAFLRGSVATGYTAALLNIYHSIPIGREALLTPFLDVLTYGYSPDWWAGTTDENSKLVSLQHASPGDTDRPNYLCEIQCLMAFLDNTTRAYGSVDALMDLRHLQYFRPQYSFTRFMEAWQSAATDEKEDDPLTQVFTSIATKGPDMMGTMADARDIVMFMVEGPVRHAQDQARLLDFIVWNDVADMALDNVWMKKLGNIFTMRIYNDEPGSTELNLLPTEIWYLDRYTPEFRDIVWDMRYESRHINQEIGRLSKAQQRVREMTVAGANPPRVNVRKTLETARDLLPTAAASTSGVEDGLDSSDEQSDYTEMQKEIAHLVEQMDLAIKRLDQQKVELNARVSTIMSDLMDPNTSTIPLRHKYVLHGASTKPNVTYFRKLNLDLIDMQSDDEEPLEMWQWWRTEWFGPDVSAEQKDEGSSTDGESFYSVRKVTVDQVREAVKSENSMAVLVYADATAMDFRPSPLSAPLRTFIEQDNRAFDREISAQHSQQPDTTPNWNGATDLMTPIDEDPFQDPLQSTHVREMTPMSTSTIRSLDGQPSPKRPRSSDDSTSDSTLMDSPPAYETLQAPEHQEMAEKKGSKMGQLTNQLLEKYSDQTPAPNN